MVPEEMMTSFFEEAKYPGESAKQDEERWKSTMRQFKAPSCSSRFLETDISHHRLQTKLL